MDELDPKNRSILENSLGAQAHNRTSAQARHVEVSNSKKVATVCTHTVRFALDYENARKEIEAGDQDLVKPSTNHKFIAIRTAACE